MRFSASSLPHHVPLAAALICVAALFVPAVTAAPPQGTAPLFENSPEWIRRSNANALLVRQMEKVLNPESATDDPTFDNRISDYGPSFQQRDGEAIRETLADLQNRLRRERNPDVREDLKILVARAEREVRQIELDDKYELPYVNPTDEIYAGVRNLLDDQIAPDRRPGALVRLRKYAGIEPGTRPLAELLEQRTREKMDQSALRWPDCQLIQRNLNQSGLIMGEIPGLFDKYKITDYQMPFATLQGQVTAYNEFIRNEVLPKCSKDFRLPPEIYAFRLREVIGVDIPPMKLAHLARAAFLDTQQQMQTLAAEVAAQHHFSSNDYRDVIRQLKKDQLEGDSIVTEYNERLKEIEQVILREKLVTLPPGHPIIRLATKAESATALAPFSKCPPMLGKTPDQQCEFVMPVNLPPGTAGQQAERVDDYTFAAASWTLTAHEARPGHELRYDATLAHGVSIARASYAATVTSGEGWGLYAEEIIRPYMPPEALLISLQYLLLREARAFLDPELQAGKITPSEALELLKKDVALSDALANSEVQRYTIFAPGQAVSYFYGYMQYMQLRKDTERAMNARFNMQGFHDFVLAQGNLPVPLIRQSVFHQFVNHRP